MAQRVGAAYSVSSHNDPQVAQVILAGIAASIMTVVSIVFAILLMTLTLASMQFSPRILVSFVRDQTTQWTLKIVSWNFCLLYGRSAGSPLAAAAFCASRNRSRRHVARDALCRLANLFHPTHQSGH